MSKLRKIVEIGFLAQVDRSIVDLVSQYWAQKPNGEGWEHLWREIKDQMLGMAKAQGVKVKDLVANAAITCGHCVSCNNPIVETFPSRESFTQKFRRQGRWGQGDVVVCDKCVVRDREAKKEIELQPFEAAFASGVYESLNDLEFNYLLALSGGIDTHKVARTFGLSPSAGQPIFEKLSRLHLVMTSKSCSWIATHKYQILDRLNDFLQKSTPKIRFKSIFGSTQAAKLYRVLKSRHGYVFPEVPLCAFIDRSSVNELLNEQWKSYYFLSCRIDFLIATREGLPISCIEYDGSYHEDERQQAKDELKSSLIQHVGLGLERIDAAKLSAMMKETEVA